MDSLDDAIRRVLNEVPGWCSHGKALEITRCVARHRPRGVVEIGVCGGRSLLVLALACKHSGAGNVTGIDPWSRASALEGEQKPTDSRWWQDVDYEGLYHGCREAIEDFGVADICRVIRAPAHLVADQFDQIDLLHIDGNHSREASLRDVERYLPKVTPRGQIWFDDADWENTQDAIKLLKDQCDVVRDYGRYLHLQKRPWKTNGMASHPSSPDRLLRMSSHSDGTEPRDAQVLVVCPSFGKQCGIGEYSRYVCQAIRSLGTSCAVVRTAQEAAAVVAGGGAAQAILVQHEFGLFRRSFGPLALSEGESTADLVRHLLRIRELRPAIKIGVILHTVVRGFSPDMSLLVRSSIPLFALHAGGAEFLGCHHLEHGVPSVEGFDPAPMAKMSARPTIGLFGLYRGGRSVAALAELCRRTGARPLVSCACRSDNERAELRACFADTDALVFDDFPGDAQLLRRLSDCDVLFLPQFFGEPQNSRSLSVSGSVRLAMLARRPIIVNTFWGYEDLASTMLLADSLDEAAAHVRHLLNEPGHYREAVDRIDRWASENCMVDVYRRLLKSWPTDVPAAHAKSGNHYGGRAGHKPLSPAEWGDTTGDIPLSIENASDLAGRFIDSIEPYPDCFEGRGIVICAGGGTYNTCAWVAVNMLRRLGCTLPIEVWHLGSQEHSPDFANLLRSLDVDFVDAEQVCLRWPHCHLAGWALKPYAVLHSRFREVLLIDADNVPVVDPTYLFDEPEYLRTGAIFWPDGLTTPPDSPRWRIFGVEYRDEPEQESGQVLVDKRRSWQALNLCNWYNEHGDFFYEHVYGDKDTFRFAWHRLGQPFAMPSRPIEFIPFTLCQHDLDGRRVFQHRALAKWTLLSNPRSEGFLYEEECLGFIDDLRRRWRPVRTFAPHLTETDYAAMRELAGLPLDFIRTGYGRWPMKLDPTGVVAEGGGPEIAFWWMEHKSLGDRITGESSNGAGDFAGPKIVFANQDGRVSYRLLPSGDANWRGRSLSNANLGVELVAPMGSRPSGFHEQVGCLQVPRPAGIPAVCPVY